MQGDSFLTGLTHTFNIWRFERGGNLDLTHCLSLCISLSLFYFIFLNSNAGIIFCTIVVYRNSIPCLASVCVVVLVVVPAGLPACH